MRDIPRVIGALMKATKQQLVDFLDSRVLTPAHDHPRADSTVKRKVQVTRMRLNQQVTAENVEQYFWAAMATDNGIDSYDKISALGVSTFEDVRADFKALCGR
jgi:hypothetical protein